MADILRFDFAAQGGADFWEPSIPLHFALTNLRKLKGLRGGHLWIYFIVIIEKKNKNEKKWHIPLRFISWDNFPFARTY